MKGHLYHVINHTYVCDISRLLVHRTSANIRESSFLESVLITLNKDWIMKTSFNWFINWDKNLPLIGQVTEVNAFTYADSVVTTNDDNWVLFSWPQSYIKSVNLFLFGTVGCPKIDQRSNMIFVCKKWCVLFECGQTSFLVSRPNFPDQNKKPAQEQPSPFVFKFWSCSKRVAWSDFLKSIVNC